MNDFECSLDQDTSVLISSLPYASCKHNKADISENAWRSTKGRFACTEPKITNFRVILPKYLLVAFCSLICFASQYALWNIWLCVLHIQQSRVVCRPELHPFIMNWLLLLKLFTFSVSKLIGGSSSLEYFLHNRKHYLHSEHFSTLKDRH